MGGICGKYKTHPSEQPTPVHVDTSGYGVSREQGMFSFFLTINTFQSFPPARRAVDYGQPYLDTDGEDDPLVSRRSCTDCVCLLLFLACMGGWGVVGYLGIKTADIRRVLYPTDSQVRHNLKTSFKVNILSL